MDSRLHKNALEFILDLTGTQTAVASAYLDEINSNRNFRAQLQGNRHKGGRGSSWAWGWGVGPGLGAVLYALCRLKKPQTVVETGVASGESSSYWLEALDKNEYGQLYEEIREYPFSLLGG